uniref:Latexin n=1 Tax=Oryzias latipes TaxID=8090 RepID=A0A3P9IXZ6_ORYLA
MGFRGFIVLVVLMGMGGSPTAAVSLKDESAHPNFVTREQKDLTVEEGRGDVMATGELNPSHFPARRAAKVVQHYLNTRYGSPYRLFGLEDVHSATAEDVADTGRRYHLQISAHEIISNRTQKCSADVFFPRGEPTQPPEVKASCEELLQNTTAQEEALYQRYKEGHSLLSAQYIPDSQGHIEPDMMPFWHLSIVASSFIMLHESTENTLYNMAQVAQITQLETEREELKFDSHMLLHDMVSQEILHWKLLFTWSPAEGVKVQQMQQIPKPNH